MGIYLNQFKGRALDLPTEFHVGMSISCDYQYDEGFSNFCNGSTLNFICVNNSSMEAVFVSDTVIPNLSFDEINAKGYIYGQELPAQHFDNCIVSVRSMSGGYDANQDSEYKKYIIDSDLGGTITPGDKKMWNWDVRTITSSSGVVSAKAVTRGGSEITEFDQVEQSSKRSDAGFRPVLVVRKLRLPPSFVNSTKFGLHGNNLNISLDDIFVFRGSNDDIGEYTISINIGDIEVYSKLTNVVECDNVREVLEVNKYLSINTMQEISITITDTKDLSYSDYIYAIKLDDLYVCSGVKNYDIIRNKSLKPNAIIYSDNFYKDSMMCLVKDNDKCIKVENEKKFSVNGDINLSFIYFNKTMKVNSFGVAFVE